MQTYGNILIAIGVDDVFDVAWGLDENPVVAYWQIEELATEFGTTNPLPSPPGTVKIII